MKTAFIAILAILIGCAIGVGSTAARFGFLPGIAAPAAKSGLPTLPTPPVGTRPVLVIDATEYDFGVMERNAKAHHVFLIRNDGDTPLTLANGGSSCKCTILGSLEGEPATVEPGASHEVELEWTAKTSSSEFRQTATIRTNDPLQPRVELSVHGRIADSIRVTPEDIVFSKIDSDQAAEGKLRIFSMRDEPLAILGHEFQNKDTADLFDIETRPLSADEIDDPGVRSAVEVTIQLKPGLPIGPIDQTLVLSTNIMGRKTIEVPVQGRVVSKLSISGPGWNEELGMLTLGRVSVGEGARRELSLNIRGENADKIELSVGSVSTDTVRVSFGEHRVLGDGRLVRVPLVVEVPAGSRMVNFMGGEGNPTAEVILLSTHPKAPKLRMLVRFAIEP